MVSDTGSNQTVKATNTKLYFNAATGTLTSTEFNLLSDSTYKTNIADIQNAYSILEQLRPVSFDWVDNNKHAFGIIAQELEVVLPELVETGKLGKTVAYTQLIPIIIKAMMELKIEVDTLKNLLNT
jgi:L-rhamnose isomerase